MPVKKKAQKKTKKIIKLPYIKHNWPVIEEAWLSGQFITLGALAKKYKVPYGMMTKRSMAYKWRARRKAIVQQGQAKAEKKLVETYAQKYFKMCERHISLAKILQSKGLTYLNKNDIDSAATAVNSVYRGARLEKNTMDGNQTQGAPPINIFNSQNTITNLRGLSDAELHVVASGGNLIESGATGGAGDIDAENGED